MAVMEVSDLRIRVLGNWPARPIGTTAINKFDLGRD